MLGMTVRAIDLAFARAGTTYKIALLTMLTVSLVFGCIVGQIEGSENMATEVREFTDFDKVDIGWGFEANITKGSEYSITITANENVMDRVIVSKRARTLRIAMKTADYSRLQLKAEIVMPALVEAELSGGSDGRVSGFGAHDEFNLELSGGSSFRMDGSANKLNARSSGGSRMLLSNFEVQDLDITMGGGGSATIKVNGRIDADLSGGSKLYYIGNPTLGAIKKSGGSSVQEK
jgi:hypothetical protein